MDLYDIIFAGGGTTACVTAGRLSAADPTLRILIIEAGPHTRDVPNHIQPARFMKNVAPGTSTVTFNVGKPSQSLLGRTPVSMSGRAVGGGSTINFMAYHRGAASDYDAWKAEYGNKGWGSDELIPLLKKAETYQAEITNDTHGTTGPIKVSFSTEYINLSTDFLEVAKSYDKTRGLSDDINAFTYTDKYGKWARYVDKDIGRRSDTAHHYIYNQSSNTNLKILDKSRVVRVIFEDTRAVGVEYINDANAPTITVAKASRLVVLSAGAFGSPAILERSGIGGKEVLERNGITQLVDLPGVGEHYMDHVMASMPFYASDEAESMDFVYRGEVKEEFEKQWLRDGTGPLAQTGIDAGGKLRPTTKELEAMSPDFDHRWKTFFADAPDKQVVTLGIMSGYFGKDPDIRVGKYFTLMCILTYPSSIGHVHVTSGVDLNSPFDFHPGFLEDVADIVAMRWAYKKARELARRMVYYRGEISSGHPEFPEGSSAAANGSAATVDITAPDILYTKEDDNAIDKFHRKAGDSMSHSCGTCAMKARAQGGVVDERLNVYGLQNLKVADLSIVPGNVGAPTYNTAIAIGEKAAIIIAQYLGIEGVAKM